jgi:hypothetical protein
VSAERQRQAAQPRWHAAALVFALLLWGALGGCAAEPATTSAPLWADPGVVRVDISRVSRPEVDVVIHNISGSPRPIGDFALGGEDWGSLRFVDDSLPRSIPVDDSVVVRLAASPAGLRVGPELYRSGRASLTFRSDQHEFAVPIELVGTAEQADGAPPAWLATVVLALLGGAALLLPRPPRPAPHPNAGPESSTGRLPVAGAIAGLLALAAMIPVGSAYCACRLGVRVGPAEIQQCRAGLGGFELTMLPATPGLWWWLIALTIVAGLLAAGRNQGAAIALSLVRVLGFALILAALLIGLAPAGLAPSDLVFAQLRPGASVPLPSWGLFAQPLACAAGFALAISLPMVEATPIQERLARLERLLWSALLTTTFLGGWSIPGLSQRAVPTLAHASTLGAELLAFALKLALVYLALTQLGELLRARQISASTLLRAHARWTTPLVFANLIGVLLWRVFQ